MLVRLFKLLVAPQWTLATIAVRAVAALLVTGGVVIGIRTTWNNYKTRLCAGQINELVIKQTQATIAELEAQNKAQAERLRAVEARRVEAEIAVQMAEDTARAAQDQLRALGAKGDAIFVPDTHVDLLNASLEALAKGGGGG